MNVHQLGIGIKRFIIEEKIELLVIAAIWGAFCVAGYLINYYTLELNYHYVLGNLKILNSNFG